MLQTATADALNFGKKHDSTHRTKSRTKSPICATPERWPQLTPVLRCHCSAAAVGPWRCTLLLEVQLLRPDGETSVQALCGAADTASRQCYAFTEGRFLRLVPCPTTPYCSCYSIVTSPSQRARQQLARDFETNVAGDYRPVARPSTPTKPAATSGNRGLEEVVHTWS